MPNSPFSFSENIHNVFLNEFVVDIVIKVVTKSLYFRAIGDVAKWQRCFENSLKQLKLKVFLSHEK